MSSGNRSERLSGERWERIQELFHRAVDLDERERTAFLRTACDGDQALFDHVAALLVEDDRADSLLDRGVAYVAERVIGAPIAAVAGTRDFGPYRIGRKLGEGGMGVVYLAERSDVGSEVAVKFLRDAWLSPARRERFASEQRTLAQLNHPSIARLYDADTLPDGTPWFVMEYVEGVPITTYCAHHRCTFEERLQLFRAVCEAVLYAHRQAIIHRDLKPSNILVRTDGAVRLLDFGIAKQLETLEAQVDQTIASMRLFTPAYAAPEHILGDRVGVQSDVYSLGVILYELLAGRQPFDASVLSARDLERAVLEGEVERPSVVTKQPALASRAAWADLDAMCLTAMHRDLARRYASVEALIRDVDRFARGEPLEARPDTVGYRAGKFVGRNRRGLAITAGVVTGIAAGIAFFTARVGRARAEAAAEAGRTARVQRFVLNLFAGGDDAVGPADDLRVVTLIDRGVQEAGALDGEPALQAELFATLGTLYRKLGKFERADELLGRAMDERVAFFGSEHREVGDSLVSLSLLRADQARYEDAERHAREGLRMLAARLPANHPAVARATFALGKVLEDRGNYTEAKRVLSDAVRLQSGLEGATSDLAASLSELANTAFYSGDYAASESLNRRVLAMHRQTYGERHPLVADTLINLGAIEFERGRYAEAEQHQREALDSTAHWYGSEHPETASALTILAQTLIYLRRFDEAATLLEPALAIARAAFGADHPRVASVLQRLGKLALERGDLDAAEGYFMQTAAIHRKAHGDGHHLVANAASNLGSVYAAKHDHVRAAEAFRQAIDGYSGALSADHAYVGIARIKLGRALLRQQRYADALAESRAGMLIVSKRPGQSSSWLEMARADSAEAAAALGDATG
jgi:eukaryotic-like serine/threonine-protein kinase